ncbi:MAG: stage III sporulation protein AD [Clostridia bacterium]|nr:stage III sporulation protein AD [Clostridia bacterium]
MMDIIKICVVAVCGLFIISLLKEYKSPLAICLVIVLGGIILFYILDPFIKIIDFIKELSDNASIPFDEIKIAIKSLGVGYIVQFSSDICRDFGESALGSKVELCGKIAILMLAIPLFTKIFDSVMVMLV